MALTEIEARALAQRVVDAAKSTAHVDTGALRRSISYTYIKGEIIFRQLFYGIYYENSMLEKYAKRYIPMDQPYKIILTFFNGETAEISRTPGGRATKKITKSYDSSRSTTDNIRRLIQRSQELKKKKEAETENE